MKLKIKKIKQTIAPYLGLKHVAKQIVKKGFLKEEEESFRHYGYS